MYDGDLQGFGSCVALTSITVINLKVLVEARHWNLILVLSVLASICSFYIVTLLTQHFLMTKFFSNAQQFRAFEHVGFRLPTWLGLIFIVVAALTPDVCAKAFKPVFSKAKEMRKDRKLRKTGPLILE
jgi:magnesium-transporting ATPase (P-type)